MLIGLFGFKGVGKTTFADVLVRCSNFLKASFATPLKRAVQEIFHFSNDQVFGTLKDVVDERFGVTPRSILQVVGTELFQYDIYNHLPILMKSIKPRKLWCERFRWWYEKLPFTEESMEISPSRKMITLEKPNVIIDDCRFKHEAEMIKELGGTCVFLDREGIELTSNHSSETEMLEIDYDLRIRIENHIDEKSLEEEILFHVESIMEM